MNITYRLNRQFNLNNNQKIFKNLVNNQKEIMKVNKKILTISIKESKKKIC